MGSLQCPVDVYNARIERLRQTEFPSLLKTTYLDHAGTTLYPSSLIDAYHEDLKCNLFGNPHSESPASDLSTQRVDAARLSVLRYFNADPAQFDVVFTANATAAIKLVADCFRDQDFWYGFHKDAHSSIVGVRELANLGSRCFVSNEDVEEWIRSRSEGAAAPTTTLFAYPAQSNMTGYRVPYSWSKQIRESGQDETNRQRTFVLLDAASYLTTGRLDLRYHQDAPDFIALSFYKIFGFPDLGALIVRKTAHDVLTHRRYFGGGTVDQVTVIDTSFHAKKTSTVHDFLEDGTLPFHNIVALDHAISIHSRLFGSAQAISEHTSYLSFWLYQHLLSLTHFNHTPVLQIHKDDHANYGDAKTQGPILSFSLLRGNGTFVGKSHFERLAIDCGFQLRTGGVCNPGGIACMLNLNHWELRRNFTEGARCGGDIDVVGGKPTGIIRVSLGAMSTLGDVQKFAHFIEHFFVESVAPRLSLQSRSTYTQQIDEPNTVTPIEHCQPMLLGTATDTTAYKVWEGQWCIVELVAGQWQPVENKSVTKELDCNLQPDKGVMCIHRVGRPNLTVNLWDRPKQVEIVYREPGTRAFDVYTDETTINWFSEATGTTCTLARYRGEDVTTLPEARTCQIPRCLVEFKTRDDLYQHYKIHAAAFSKSQKPSSLSGNEIRDDDQWVSIPPKTRRSWARKPLTIALSITEVSSSMSSPMFEKGNSKQGLNGKPLRRRCALVNKVRSWWKDLKETI